MEVDKDFADAFAKTQMISGMYRSRSLSFSPKGSLPSSPSKTILKRTKEIEKEEKHRKVDFFFNTRPSQGDYRAQGTIQREGLRDGSI